MDLIKNENRIIYDAVANQSTNTLVFCDFDQTLFQLTVLSDKHTKYKKLRLSIKFQPLQNMERNKLVAYLESVMAGSALVVPQESPYDLCVVFTETKHAPLLKQHCLSFLFYEAQKAPGKPLSVFYNTNELFSVEQKEDRLLCKFLFCFPEKDIVLAKLLLTGLEDCKDGKGLFVISVSRVSELKVCVFEVAFMFFPLFYTQSAYRQLMQNTLLSFRENVKYGLSCLKIGLNTKMRGKTQAFLSMLD